MNCDEPGKADALALQVILAKLRQKRVTVLGPPCVGKSTILRHLPRAIDMDDVLFPRLSEEEKRIVFQKPWIPAAGDLMRALANEIITVEPGRPFFATVVIAADWIIYLDIDDELLRKRIELRHERRQSFDDVKGIQAHLLRDIGSSGIPSHTYRIRAYSASSAG